MCAYFSHQTFATYNYGEIKQKPAHLILSHEAEYSVHFFKGMHVGKLLHMKQAKALYFLW